MFHGHRLPGLAPARPAAWQRNVLRWGMLLTLIEQDAADWARQEALSWLEEERRGAGGAQRNREPAPGPSTRAIADQPNKRLCPLYLYNPKSPSIHYAEKRKSSPSSTRLLRE